MKYEILTVGNVFYVCTPFRSRWPDAKDPTKTFPGGWCALQFETVQAANEYIDKVKMLPICVKR